MSSLFVTLAVFLVVAGLLYWLIELLPLPPPVKRGLDIALVLLLFLWVLSALGVLGHPWRLCR